MYRNLSFQNLIEVNDYVFSPGNFNHNPRDFQRWQKPHKTRVSSVPTSRSLAVENIDSSSGIFDPSIFQTLLLAHTISSSWRMLGGGKQSLFL